jgi:N-methylhydantoinase B/oxoprolinase/acetone carboxylase alpha subunit
MKEFNWSEYREKILKKRVKKHGSKTAAIIEMDAQIASLKTEIKSLRSLIDWSEVNEIR